MPFGEPRVVNEAILSAEEVKALSAELMRQTWPLSERGNLARIAHIKLQRYANRDLSLVVMTDKVTLKRYETIDGYIMRAVKQGRAAKHNAKPIRKARARR